MKQLPSYRVILISGGAIFLLALWLSAGNKIAPEQNVALPHFTPPAPKPVAAETHESFDHQTEIPVTFAQRMPSGNGTSIITSSGNYNGNAIHVAVPDQFHKIQYLPGSDPRAVEYLKEKQAAHDQMIFDSGPSDVDLSAMAMKNSISGHARKIAAKVESK